MRSAIVTSCDDCPFRADVENYVDYERGGTDSYCSQIVADDEMRRLSIIEGTPNECPLRVEPIMVKMSILKPFRRAQTSAEIDS